MTLFEQLRLKAIAKRKDRDQIDLDNFCKRYSKYYMAFYFKSHYGLSMKEVKKILDHATSPCEKAAENPDKEEKVGEFIKENIINKAPEYPEYDNATFESTMNELLNNAKKYNKYDTYMHLDKDTLEEVMTELRIDHEFIDMDQYDKYINIIRTKIDKVRDTLIKDAPIVKEDFWITQLLKVAPCVDIFRNIKHVYIINGYARAGKDTFVKFASDTTLGLAGFKVANISSVQSIKDISEKYFGYNDKHKTDKDRKFLSDFKALTTEYCDYSLETLKRDLVVADMLGYSYIFIHIREPKEIDRARKMINEILFPHFEDRIMMLSNNIEEMKRAEKFYMTRTIFITNSRVNHKVTNNASDLEVENYDYDITIDNCGTLKEFKLAANNFATKELGLDTIADPMRSL